MKTKSTVSTVPFPSCLFIGLLTISAALTLTACAGGGDRRDPNYASKDGTTIVTRGSGDEANYGSDGSNLDQQADEKRVNILKNKTSF
jgi:hypothetical protein